MTGLVVWTVIDVLLLVAGLAFYLFWVGTLLTRIAGNLEECAEIVRTIVGHAKLIGPGVEHINETGGVEAVLAEGLQHHLFLGRVLGKVRM